MNFSLQIILLLIVVSSIEAPASEYKAIGYFVNWVYIPFSSFIQWLVLTLLID